MHTTGEQTGNPQVAYCRVCGKALGSDEQQISLGVIYCAEHVPVSAAPPPAAGAWPPNPAAAPPPSSSQSSPWTAPPTAPPPGPPPLPGNSVSPGLAFILGLLPGVGAIYNAQYAKGLVHVVVFGLLISAANADSVGEMQPLIGILIPTFVFYMAFEAYHTAKKRELGLPVDEFSSVFPSAASTRSGPPVGPVILIAFGVLFLLNNFGLFRISQLLRFWPLGLIALGVYMLYARLNERETFPPAAHRGGPSREASHGGVPHE